MKNILHVIDTCGPGGAETVFLELAKGLDARRWRSFVAIPGKGWVYDTLVENGFDPILTPLHRAFDVRYLAALCGAVRKHRIDLIQTHLFGAGIYGGLAGLLCGVPVISTLHGRPDLDGNARYRAVKFGIMRRGVTKVVFVSESLRRFFLSSGDLQADRTTVITDGIDVSVFAPRRATTLRQELGVGDREVLVGAVGNLRPAKSYDVLLRAAALLQQQPLPYRFVVVGEAQGALYQELLALRDRLGLGSTVTFTGFKRGVHDVMNNLDLYASTSSSEGFSLSVVQAMACGVPVVATKSGGPEEIITHNVDGLLVDADSPEQVARALQRLGTEPATRGRLTEAGRKAVEARFTLTHMVNSYEHLYDQCVRAA
jgi:glycosyltransferase involved in cell wall biosynthesis